MIKKKIKSVIAATAAAVILTGSAVYAAEGGIKE